MDATASHGQQSKVRTSSPREPAANLWQKDHLAGHRRPAKLFAEVTPHDSTWLVFLLYFFPNCADNHFDLRMKRFVSSGLGRACVVTKVLCECSLAQQVFHSKYEQPIQV